MQKFTSLVVYGSMLIVVICAATALRNLQKANQVTQQMQLSLTNDITKLPVMQQALRVRGPPENPDGDNLGLSLDTGDQFRSFASLHPIKEKGGQSPPPSPIQIE